MRFFATTICLWIAVIATAISLGGNVFQMVVIDPIWSGAPPESVRSLASETPLFKGVKRFHTNPLYAFALVCLLSTPFLAWTIPEARKWLLSAVGIYLVIVLGTILYVWPINKALFEQAGSGLDATTIAAMTRHWLLADRIRLVFRMMAFLCLLRAMSVLASSADSRPG
jgi:uncharacterized membrane protein